MDLYGSGNGENRFSNNSSPTQAIRICMLSTLNSFTTAARIETRLLHLLTSPIAPTQYHRSRCFAQFLGLGFAVRQGQVQALPPRAYRVGRRPDPICPFRSGARAGGTSDLP